MKQVTIYNESTGVIRLCMSGTDEDINNNTLEGEAVYEGFVYPDQNKILDGQIEAVDILMDWEEVRTWRNGLLSESDWTQGSDSPLTEEKKAEWITYRQALRDLPETNAEVTELDEIIFPDVPE